MKQVLYSIKFIILIVIGIMMGFFLQFLSWIKIVNFVNLRRLPRMQGNMIIVSNHPAIPETLFLPLMFINEFMRHPIKLSPWSVPDKKNYYDKVFWYFFRLRSVPIERGNRREEVKSIIKMKDILKDEGIIVIFPEGGRTGTKNSAIEIKYVYSNKKNKIKEFKTGVGVLAQATNATIVPIWVEGTDKIVPNQKYFNLRTLLRFNPSEKVYIKIGIPFKCPKQLKNKESTKKLVKLIEQSVLETADE